VVIKWQKINIKHKPSQASERAKYMQIDRGSNEEGVRVCALLVTSLQWTNAQ